MSEDLTQLKVADLRKRAEDANVEGWEDMSRAQLLAALSDPADEDAADEAEEAGKKPAKSAAKPAASKLHPQINDKTPGKFSYPRVSKFAKFVEIAPGLHEQPPAPGTKAFIMKEKLMAQGTTRIIVPLESGEKPGKSTKAITLNGYVLHVEKGTYVEVPNQVAEIIMESEKQTQAAVNTDTRIDDGGQGKDLGTL